MQKLMKKEGIVFRTGINVGVDLPISRIKKQFDAVCLAGGSRVPRDLKIQGRDLRGIYFAMDYLIQSNRRISREKIPENKLIDIFYKYGQERWAKRIAKTICKVRSENKIKTSSELAEIVKSAIPVKFRVRKIHPATRIFQAIRIEVNDELDAIRNTIAHAYKYIAKGGVIIAISFHSLEDRIVKKKFRQLARGCSCGREGLQCPISGY